MASNLWDYQGVLFFDFLMEQQTINAAYYLRLLKHVAWRCLINTSEVILHSKMNQYTQSHCSPNFTFADVLNNINTYTIYFLQKNTTFWKAQDQRWNIKTLKQNYAEYIGVMGILLPFIWAYNKHCISIHLCHFFKDNFYPKREFLDNSGCMLSKI